MYIKDKNNGDLVEVLSVADLVNPFHPTVAGRYHAGEEMGEPMNFKKVDMAFPSGEALPVCWVDPNYR